MAENIIKAQEDNLAQDIVTQWLKKNNIDVCISKVLSTDTKPNLGCKRYHEEVWNCSNTLDIGSKLFFLFLLPQDSIYCIQVLEFATRSYGKLSQFGSGFCYWGTGIKKNSLINHKEWRF